MGRPDSHVGSHMVPLAGTGRQGTALHPTRLWGSKLISIRTYNDNLASAATVDIEDMPRQTALQLAEALTIVKHIAGDHYPEVVTFHDSLRDALGQERPIWKM